MAGAAVPSFLPNFLISGSQDEALADFREGFERDGLYNLDETPSQNLGLHLPMSPSPCESENGSESSESMDGDGDLGYTQEPVQWISPPSSAEANVDVEGNAEAVENSYDEAFESDRSQSPTQDWQGQIEHCEPQANLGMSADFLTQPASGVQDFQFTSSEDLEQQILRRDTIPEAEFHLLPKCSLPLLFPIPEDNGNRAPDVLAESCMQPYTQPAVETQPFELLSQIQLMQLAVRSNEVVRDPAARFQARCVKVEPQLMQQGREGDGSVMDAPAVSDNGIDHARGQGLEGDDSGLDALAVSDNEIVHTEEQGREGDDSVVDAPTVHDNEIEHTEELGLEGEDSGVDAPAVHEDEIEHLDHSREKGREGDDSLMDAPAVNDNEIEHIGEHSSQERVRDDLDPPSDSELPIEDSEDLGPTMHEQQPQDRARADLPPSDFQLPAEDSEDLGSKKHKQQPEHRSSIDIPLLEADSGSESSDKAQPLVLAETGTERTPSNSEQMPTGNGHTNSLSETSKRVNHAASSNSEQMPTAKGDTNGLSETSKRVNHAGDLPEQHKRQRVEPSHERIRNFPMTVMDVVRSRSRSSSYSVVEEESNILNILMRTGVRFPPFVYEKRSM